MRARSTMTAFPAALEQRAEVELLQDGLPMRPGDFPVQRRQRRGGMPRGQAGPGVQVVEDSVALRGDGKKRRRQLDGGEGLHLQGPDQGQCGEYRNHLGGGHYTDTCGSSPMTRAEVTENTNTPMAIPNVRHTSGSSRNRFSRGDRLPKAHCTTRKTARR